MPWSGGVYTRGYPSWTNDANNNLPISANKFDTEDNDFAAGLNNCLTIDGLNKPNATLNWSQLIALTRASDGSLFSIARTSGSNNPSLTWAVSSSGNSITAALATGNNALSFVPTAYQFGNATDNPSFTFLGTGSGSTAGTWTFTKVSSAFNTGAIYINTVGSAAIGFNDSTASANNRAFALYGASAVFNGAVFSDDGTVGRNFLTVTRSASAVATVQLGNVNDNAPVQYAIASALREIGFRNGEPNPQNTPYTLQQSDGGRVIESAATAGGTITVPQLALGTTITYINGTTGNITLAQGTGMTLRLGNSAGTTGNRTVAQWASAFIYWTATNVAYVFGGGVS